MALSDWFTGSERTNVRDARLYLAEWRAVLDKLEELWGILGPLPSGTTVADTLSGIATSQAQGAGTQHRNLRIVPALGEEAHQVRVTADGLGIEDVFVSTVDLVVDVAASGALGLSTGTEAIDTWYALWVGYTPDGGGGLTGIFDPSFTKGGLTLSGGLSAYTKWRRVGARRNNHLGDLVPASQGGTTVVYDARMDQAWDDASTPGLVVAAAQTSTTVATVDCSPLVPPSAFFGDVCGVLLGTTTTHTGFLYPGNTVLTGSAIGPVFIANQSANVDSTIVYRLALSDDSEIAYRVSSGASMTITVQGYEDLI